MDRLLTLLCAAVMLACGGRPQASASTCLRYEPDIVELLGNVVMEEKYGPPNFGEEPKTDKRLSVPMLVLVRPIDVCADSTSKTNTAAFRGVRKVQLIVLASVIAVGSFINSDVLADGSLSRAVSGQHFY